LSPQGLVVHDSHAEQLARRGFIRFVNKKKTIDLKYFRIFLSWRYLYGEIDHFQKNEESIFEKKTDDEKLILKSSIHIHFYTSFAPCGDSALFTPRDKITEATIKDEHEIYRTARVQGQLRSKIENGLSKFLKIITFFFPLINYLKVKEQFQLKQKVVFYLLMLLQMVNMFDICHVPIKFFVGMFWVFKVPYFLI